MPAPVDDGAPIDCGAPSIDGTWHGTIDGFQFSASGSNAVTMTFALQGDGALVGTVYFGGVSTAPPPPTDP